MPIYEYRCKTCDRQFETLVFTSSDRLACPSCGSEEVTRMFSVFAFKTGADKDSAGSRMGSGASSCSGCTATSCKNCH